MLIAIGGFIAGFIEGYIPIICWVLLIANLIALIFFKEGKVKKFIGWSMIGFFIGYFTSCTIIARDTAEAVNETGKQLERIADQF